MMFQLKARWPADPATDPRSYTKYHEERLALLIVMWSFPADKLLFTIYH